MSVLDNAGIFPDKQSQKGEEVMAESEGSDDTLGTVADNQLLMAEVENVVHEPFKTSEEIKVKN